MNVQSFINQKPHISWYDLSNVFKKTSRQPMCSDKNPFLCHAVHHKSHAEWPRIEPGSPRWEAGDTPPEPRHGTLPALHSTTPSAIRAARNRNPVKYSPNRLELLQYTNWCTVTWLDSWRFNDTVSILG